MTVLIVGIATSGRRDVLTETVAHLAGQSRRPDRILICPADDADIDMPALGELGLPVEVVRGGKGLCRQRNAILDAIGHQDGLLAFFDDDFLPAADFCEHAVRLFERHADVAMATGRVLADGILGPGLTASDGRRHLAELYRKPQGEPVPEPVHNGYGCNMVIRIAPVQAHRLRFDETLPLYGWLEDVDFSRRLHAYGQIVRSAHLQGVHLGSKKGRSPGRRLGYSQIANPVYLKRKQSVSLRFASNQMARNIAANLVKVLRPEPWVDRRGRVIGNLLGLRDLVTGRIHPGRITEMP